MSSLSYTTLDLEPRIAAARTPTCLWFHFEFQKARNEAREAGDHVQARAWHSLMCIAWYHLRSDDLREPLVSPGQMGTMRFPAPSDLTTEELDALFEAYPSVLDPDLRARMADVLWLVRNDHEAGRVAIDAYLDSAKRLHAPEHWVPCHERLERALHLARSLDKRGPTYQKAVAAIIEIQDRSTWPDYPHLPVKLSELMLTHRDADAAIEASRMVTLAGQAEAAGELRVARHARSMEAKWREKGGDRDAANLARLAIVEFHEREADLSQGNPFQAAHHLEAAIKACRQLPGQQARAQALIRKLGQVQQQLVGHMKHVEVRQDVSEVVERARGAVSGKPFLDAIVVLAQMVAPMSRKDLRRFVDESRQRHPMLYLIQSTVHDKRGHAVAKVPSLPWDEEGGDATLMRMHQHATQRQNAMATAIIEPARSQILADHPSTMRDFMPIAGSSRFVPSGREALYARGLCAGLEGDFTEAAHILIPQVENSIREVFAEAGVLTTKHLQDGTQRQADLNDLLGAPRADEILGEDLSFTLRGLLIRASGSNLRNRLAHGLIDDHEFLEDRYVYLWGLVLRLVVMTALPPQVLQEDQPEESNQPNDPEP
ncbi:DUF4209 domain-containing protein [Paraliomyxa miuraensis]|uniref:DUF4209 domain-containing protein n=1 Tax=Paraliomyxa miuraensis TaxID=376150 RepID=UPI0022580BEE|nr:DUF4209 domain-containing protein [Paraliomyxa miuraensis]MCX4239225.1 DUF4209 domain-containing protein [Paraliomyxa miuraensis]